VVSTTTAGGGGFTFTNQLPGESYYLQFEVAGTYLFSPQDQGGDDIRDSDANPATGQTICTELSSGESDPIWDAGLYQPVSIGDLVWNDQNQDGIQDGGEVGISGITVNL